MADDPAAAFDIKRGLRNVLLPGAAGADSAPTLRRGGWGPVPGNVSFPVSFAGGRLRIGGTTPSEPAPATVAPTSDAVNAGPPRAGVVDASSGVLPPSRLDASQPLPAGVRLRSGTPGSNDVIYEGRGRFGERAFGNNQFNVDGRARGVNPGLDVLAASRSAEIGRSVAAQNAAQAARDNAAAIAPKNAEEYAKVLTATAGARKTAEEAAGVHEQTLRNRALGVLDVRGKANANDIASQFTKAGEGVRDAAVAQGASYADAVTRGNIAAARAAAAAGLDPSSADLPASVREGDTAVRQRLADVVNSRDISRAYGADPEALFQFGEGSVLHPQDTNPGEYSITRSGALSGNRPVLIGPSGRRRFISDEELQLFQPYIDQAAKGMRRRQQATAGR